MVASLTPKVDEKMNARNELEPRHHKEPWTTINYEGDQCLSNYCLVLGVAVSTISRCTHNAQSTKKPANHDWLFCGWNPKAELPYGRPLADWDTKFDFPRGHPLHPDFVAEEEPSSPSEPDVSPLPRDRASSSTNPPAIAESV